MAEYRIKTTTNHKGETIYVPQEGYVRSYGHWNPQKEVVWVDLPLPGQEFNRKETASACLRIYMQKSKAEFIEAMKQSIAAVNKAKELILEKEAPPTKKTNAIHRSPTRKYGGSFQRHNQGRGICIHRSE